MLNKTSLSDIAKSHTIIAQDSDFAYILPSQGLRNWISNYTLTFPSKTLISDDYTILPHGCVTLVFFYHEDKLHSLLFGPLSEPILVGTIANTCDVIFIVEFQPAGFFPFVSIQQDELTNKIIPFHMVDELLDHDMKYVFSTALSADVFICELENIFFSHIQTIYPNEFRSAVQYITQHYGILNVHEIASKTFYSTRHLNQLFHQYLGLSIKSFSRFVRINRAIHLINMQNKPLSSISDELKYYDDSHFFKDFYDVCKITPQEYIMNVFNFYSEIAK